MPLAQTASRLIQRYFLSAPPPESSTTRASVDTQTPTVSAQSASRQSTRIAGIFEYNPKLAASKYPRNNGRSQLALCFFSELNLNHHVRTLRKLDTKLDGNLNSYHWHRQLDNVHRMQSLLLDSIFLVYSTLPDEFKCTRDYRLMLPLEDQGELEGRFSENVLFAAQAITAGFRVRSIERYSDALREPASQLVAAFQALRFVYRERAIEGIQQPYETVLGIVTRDFDWAWTRFEQKLCFAYFTAMNTPSPRASPVLNFNSVAAMEQDDLFQILLSETIARSIKAGYFTQDDIASCEPFLVFVVPRLAIVFGLVHSPEYLLCALKKDANSEAVIWFGTRAKELEAVKLKLMELSSDEIAHLEKRLVNSLNPSAQPETTPLRSDKIQQLFCDISAVADELQIGRRAKQFSHILGRVFAMHEASTSAAVASGTTRSPTRYSAWRSDAPFPRSNEILASALL